MQQKINYLMLLSILLMLTITSCVPYGKKHNMEDPSTTNDNKRIETTEEIPLIDNKYLNLLDIVERMRVFLEEEAELRNEAKICLQTCNWQEKEQKIFLTKLQQDQESIKYAVDQLYEDTSHLLYGKRSINEYLKNLLKYRIMLLEVRGNMVDEFLSDNIMGLTKICLPTSKNFFDFFNQDPLFNQTKDFNEKNRVRMIAKFELLNLLIREIFKTCSLDELDEENIKLLRTSVQLHPILTGERKDLGNLDEAGGPYAIIEPILLGDTKDNQKEYPYLAKCYSMIKQVEAEADSKAKIKNPFPITWRIASKLYKILIKDCKIGNETKVNSFLLGHKQEMTQELLTIKNKFDLEIWKAHFVTKKQVDTTDFLANFNQAQLKLRKKLQTRSSKIQTDYEAGKWPFDLPNPSFLTNKLKKNDPLSRPQICKKKKKQAASFKKQIKQEEYKTTELLAEQETSKKLTVSEQKETVQEPDIKLSKQEDVAHALQTTTTIKEEKQEEADEAYDIQDNSSYNKQNKLPVYQIKQEESMETSAVQSSFTFDQWLTPRGLRSFHARMFNSPYQPIRLRDNKKQDIVDQLFDSQQQCNVTYKKFVSVWEYRGGKIYGNRGGGSHQELYGPQGESLYSIFVSPDGYGKGTIGYLKTALLYAGVRPSKWMK